MKGDVERGLRLRRDLLTVFENVARSSPKSADRFLDAAERTFRQLADMPGMGESCDPVDFEVPGLRRCAVTGYRNYSVYYLPIEGGVRILRVLHGARDTTDLLDASDLD